MKCEACGTELTTMNHYRAFQLDFCGPIHAALWGHYGGGMTEKAIDAQVGGNHYKDMKIQPIEFTLANGLGFCEGNVIKYVSRWKNKNGVEDLRKARHYIDMLIESVVADADKKA